MTANRKNVEMPDKAGPTSFGALIEFTSALRDERSSFEVKYVIETVAGKPRTYKAVPFTALVNPKDDLNFVEAKTYIMDFLNGSSTGRPAYSPKCPKNISMEYEIRAKGVLFVGSCPNDRLDEALAHAFMVRVLKEIEDGVSALIKEEAKLREPLSRIFVLKLRKD